MDPGIVEPGRTRRKEPKMIKVENAVKVLKCDEKTWENRKYYKVTVIDNDGDVYVMTTQKPVQKGMSMGFVIQPSERKETMFRPSVGGLL